jgi:hypothetical protein
MQISAGVKGFLWRFRHRGKRSTSGPTCSAWAVCFIRWWPAGRRVAEDTPRPIREIIPETPQWLCDIIAKLHAKNPDDRYLVAGSAPRLDQRAEWHGQLRRSRCRCYAHRRRLPFPPIRAIWISVYSATTESIACSNLWSAEGCGSRRVHCTKSQRGHTHFSHAAQALLPASAVPADTRARC